MTADTIEPGSDADALHPSEAHRLLDFARRAITSQLAGREHEAPQAPPPASPLGAIRASFVTLRRAGTLRGCIGSLEATGPLVESVWQNARRAAFHDPRFPPLSGEELADLRIHVSVLTPLVAMAIGSEADLLDQLEPGVDGLVIEDGAHRATFLPDVWESLPDPRRFIDELKRKAGLAAGERSSSLRAWRYRTHAYDE